MATSRYGRPGTYPEKSIGLGNLDRSTVSISDRISVEIVLNVCGPNLKWHRLWMCCTCANLG